MKFEMFKVTMFGEKGKKFPPSNILVFAIFYSSVYNLFSMVRWNIRG